MRDKSRVTGFNARRSARPAYPRRQYLNSTEKLTADKSDVLDGGQWGEKKETPEGLFTPSAAQERGQNDAQKGIAFYRHTQVPKILNDTPTHLPNACVQPRQNAQYYSATCFGEVRS